VQAAEACLRQAEQDTPPSKSSPPEFAKQQPESAKQQAAPVSVEGEARLLAENPTADERQAQLRAIASDLLYWKGGLKVLRMAQLPKWRGCFQWQIEAQIEELQVAYARLCAEATKEGG
jgi:hypothetical protein